MDRTDAELLIASRDDAHAFRELYDRWADRLLAYFYRRTLDAEVAGAELEDIARARLAAAHLPLTLSVTAPPSADIEIEGAQGDRFAEGCPIIVGVAAKDNGRELVVGIWD